MKSKAQTTNPQRPERRLAQLTAVQSANFLHNLYKNYPGAVNDEEAPNIFVLSLQNHLRQYFENNKIVANIPERQPSKTRVAR